MGSKVGHSLASRAGSLLRDTGLNDVLLSLRRISFSIQCSLLPLQKCRKILWCPAVDGVRARMPTIQPSSFPCYSSRSMLIRES